MRVRTSIHDRAQELIALCGRSAPETETCTSVSGAFVPTFRGSARPRYASCLARQDHATFRQLIVILASSLPEDRNVLGALGDLTGARLVNTA
eukprot:2602649-Pleurochrysis_carterae.AAC.1